MKVASLETLQAIRNRVVADLRLMDHTTIHASLRFDSYHGFCKSYLPEPYLSDMLRSFGYTPQEVQVEVVRVVRDLREEIHYHADATASIWILGKSEHFPNPHMASAYHCDAWHRVGSGETFDFLPGQAHGFTVDTYEAYGSSQGILYFLSAQSPPITGGPEGRDDYHK